jgi:RNA recognition motif-containing protein
MSFKQKEDSRERERSKSSRDQREVRDEKKYKERDSRESSLSKEKEKYRQGDRDRDRGDRYRDRDRERRDSRERDRRINQIFIARLSYEVTEKDLDEKFSKYGSIKRIQLKKGFAFIEYYNYRDAEEAVYAMNERKFYERRIVVQLSNGRKDRRDSRDRDRRDRRDSRDRDRRDSRDSRDRDRRRNKGPQPNDRCHICNEYGHWKTNCQKGNR